MTGPQFVIDGREYPVPGFDDMTMNEAMVIDEYSGLSLDEAEVEPLRATVLAARMHIAYARGNPDLTKAQVREVVGQTNLMGALAKLKQALGEDEDSPPGQTPSDDEHEKPLGSEPSSGNGSSNGSDAQVSDPLAIGTQQSAISAT